VRLSIVVPTLNRGGLLHALLRQLPGQRWEDWECWVVDQSDPGQLEATREVLAGLADPRFHHLALEVRGLPNARNEGLARVRGEVVLFLDDDVILVDDSFLDAHLSAYEDPGVGGATGRIVERFVRPNAPDTASHLSPGGRTITNLWGTAPRDLPTLKGANMSYRVEACRQVGGFDRRYQGTALLEDSDYSTRIAAAGWRLRYVPAAELVHLSSPTGGVRVEGAMRYERWRFRNTAYFVARNRGPLALVPFAATFGMIAVLRAARWRSPSAPGQLAGAAWEGLLEALQGPDTEVPGWR
jgi:GT2 family glycosyltransferase